MATFTMEYWQDDGWFVGRLREIPGCFSQAETVEDLERNLLEVYELLREDSDSPSPPNALTKTIQTAACSAASSSGGSRRTGAGCSGTERTTTSG